MAIFKTVQVLLGDAGQWFSIRHFQVLCMTIVVAVIGGQMNLDRPRMDSGHFYGMVHVGCLAACLGAQLWVIFVGGMTMFFILPRHMFGKLQAFLFPMFFLWCLVTSGLTLSTLATPSSIYAWDRPHWTQTVCLYISFMAAAINCIFFAPRIIDSMIKTFQFEVQVGAGNIVGHAYIKELVNNAEYVKCYRKFRRCHSGSALLNVISLLCNVIYLSHLVSKLTPHSSPSSSSTSPVVS